VNWLTSFFSDATSKVVDSLGTAIDKLVTSDEEKLQLKNELAVAMNSLTITMETKAIEFEQEITKRWTSDNEHLVTRLVRPISYMLVLTVFGIMIFTDGNIGMFSIKDGYLPIIETLLATMTIAYFGSRGVEKTMKHFKSKEN
jgi:Na+/serine symporter